MPLTGLLVLRPGAVELLPFGESVGVVWPKEEGDNRASSFGEGAFECNCDISRCTSMEMTGGIGLDGEVAIALKWGSTTALCQAVCNAVKNRLGPAGLGTTTTRGILNGSREGNKA